jgi:hypothetical protein
MDERRDVRASDADRRGAADRLRAAMDEGRLDFLEYDTRLARAFSAVTYGDLDQLFTDLPAQHDRAPAKRRSRDVPSGWAPAPPPVQGLLAHVPAPLKVLWTIWLVVLSVNLTAWLLVSANAGDPVHFWPMWLLIPGAALPGVTVGVVAARRNREQQARPCRARRRTLLPSTEGQPARSPSSARSAASRVRRGRTSTSRTARASAAPLACTIDRCFCARVSAV